jgi:hypothetical protein
VRAGLVRRDGPVRVGIVETYHPHDVAGFDQRQQPLSIGALV